MEVGGPQHREIGTLISTGNGSWGRGPNIEADQKSAFNNVQVGDGANTENFVKKFYRQCQLGITNLILLKYHFCPTPMHESNYVFLFLST